jgi:molybdopterin-guanine dinucleotide biosynthesis protein A
MSAGTPEALAPNALVGVVLAGGRSRRMGRDKATLCLDGEAMAARAARRLRPVVATVVMADGGRALIPSFFSVADAAVGGPAAGLLGAAARFPGHPLLVLACDLPAVPSVLLAELATTEPEADLVMPRHGPDRLEPLCARWGVHALACLADRTQEGQLALHPLASAPGLRTYFLEGEALAAFGDPVTMLRNVNRPEDLDAVRRPYRY